MRSAMRTTFLPLALAAITLSLTSSVAEVQGQEKPTTAPAATVKTTYIKVGHLFDSSTGTYREGAILVIANERIQSVEPSAFSIPQGERTVDLSADYVLPGLIDCHTHLGSRADQYDPINDFKLTPFTSAIAGVVNAQRTLDAGFTSVRDVGSLPFLAVDLRNSIDAGFIPGPRIVASGPPLSITGGHGDLNNYAPETSWTMFPAERDYAIADGPEEIRKTIRAQVKYGVDVIKILASGGVLSKGDQPGAPQYTFEELKMAADTAHASGRKIAAHAHGTQSIKDSIRAGIDSIEHVSFVDDEGIALAKQHGTYFVMDIYNDDYILGKAREFGMPQEQINKERTVGQTQRANFRKAHAAGVKMAFGTDAGVYPHGDNAKQFHTMVQFGMTPAEAIQSATYNAADLIGRSADVGILAPGHYADLIAVTTDPLAHVEVLEHIPYVMKGGVVVKDQLSAK